jgi:hypothetical protein
MPDLLKKTVAALMMILATDIALGECFHDGSLVTVTGIVSEQTRQTADGEKTSVPILVMENPLCVFTSDDDITSSKAISVTRIQVVGTPPPVGAMLELRGRLNAGSGRQDYAEPIAISVVSGRRIAREARAAAAVSIPAAVPLTVAAPYSEPSSRNAAHVASKEDMCRAVAALAQKSLEAKRAGIPVGTIYAAMDKNASTQASSALNKDVVWLMYTKPPEYSLAHADNGIYAACMLDGLQITIDLSKHDPRYSSVPRP